MTTGPLQMKKGERRRQEILRAAGELFRQKGYRGTTMLDITERVNCSKGSVYHHFVSKLHILEAICQGLSQQAYDRYAALGMGRPVLDRLLAPPFPSGRRELPPRASADDGEEGRCSASA